MDCRAQKLKSGLANRCRVSEMRIRILEITDESPVIYMWWFRHDAARVILAQIGDDVTNERIMHDQIDGEDYLALYVGKGKSCRERFSWHIRQHHDERTVRHGFLSTLRQTMCAVMGVNAVGNEAVVNAFIDQSCVLDWTCFPGITPEELGRIEKEKILSGYFPLNIQGNGNLPRDLKRALRKMRSDAKHGRFPSRKSIEDGTWTQKDLNALVAAGWDEIYYPDELDKLKASVLGTGKKGGVLPKLSREDDDEMLEAATPAKGEIATESGTSKKGCKFRPHKG